MRNFTLLSAVLCTIASSPALAQPEMTTGPQTTQPSGAASCQDLIVYAQMKMENIIDADKKAAALPHMLAAESASDKNDVATCKTQVQQALDTVK